jgi:hypothetical protein
MGDRDLPVYDPDRAGDLDDYWGSSASYQESKRKREEESEAKMGLINSKSDWLRALSVSLVDEDQYIFDRLKEIARGWSQDKKEQSYMIKILDNILNLQTHW